MDISQGRCHCRLPHVSAVSLLGATSIGKSPMLIDDHPVANLTYYLEQIIFGVIGILAGLLSILFPETTGLGLPETMEEALSIGKTPTRFRVGSCSNGFRAAEKDVNE